MKITFFYGLAKNVGKTTTLNLYLREVKKPSEIAVTSIGWDGESYDHLFGHSKPPIFLRPGTRAITFTRFKPEGAELIRTFNVHSPMFGELAMYRILRLSRVELVGPWRLSDLKYILRELREEVEELILDGAVDRRIGFSVATQVYIILSPIVVPLKGEDRDYQMLSDIARAYHKLFSPESEVSEGVHEVLDGALTAEGLERLWRRGVREVTLSDPSKLVLFPSELVTWQRRVNFKFLRVPALKALVWNPFDVELGRYDLKAKEVGERLASKLSNLRILEPVYQSF